MKKILLFILSAVLLCGCGSSKGGRKSKSVKGIAFAQMYAEQPSVIAILPPLGEGVGEDARKDFHRFVYVHLGHKGYNLVDHNTMMNKLNETGLQHVGAQIDSDCSAFKNMLGADAVLFTTILERGRDGDGIVVAADFLLKSTTTGQVLYHRVGTVYKPSTSILSGSGIVGDLLATGLNMAKDAITTDYLELYDKCNEIAFKDLPYGPTHRKFNTDQAEKTGRESVNYNYIE